MVIRDRSLVTPQTRGVLMQGFLYVCVSLHVNLYPYFSSLLQLRAFRRGHFELYTFDGNPIEIVTETLFTESCRVEHSRVKFFLFFLCTYRLECIVALIFYILSKNTDNSHFGEGLTMLYVIMFLAFMTHTISCFYFFV